MEKEEIKTFPMRVGIKLKGIVDQQKKQISDATYGCVNPTDAEAGEIIAKKFLKEV